MSTPAMSSTGLHYGSSYDASAKTVTFSIYSKNATRIELCFFKNPIGGDENERVLMTNGNNGKWSIKLPATRLIQYGGILYYGYRIWGPNWVFDEQWKPGNEFGFKSDCDENGNRFNPNKLLIDPWATEISHDPQPRLSRIDPNEYDDCYYSGKGYRHLNTGCVAPKSILTLFNNKATFGTKPKRLLKDDIIYEVHLRGLTCQDISLPEEIRGTYRGAGMKASYLRELGITAVEFLPVHQFASEQNDDNDPLGDNYWGYMTLGFFAPNRRYSSDKSAGGPTKEFKEMVHAFHTAGIKVFIDVVFNHTGEGLLKRATEDNDSREDDYKQFPDRAGLLSFRGIDNSSYYCLRSSNADHGIPNQRYQDNSACGGNLDATAPVVQSLILDSLKYWSMSLGVDGFRFDLATVLGNTLSDGGFYFNIGEEDCLLKKIRSELPHRTTDDPSGIDLIAEPWAMGSGYTYQLGHFPDGWSEWNDVYRTTLRQFENKLWVIDLPPFRIANAIAGSDREFRQNSSRKEPHPWNSINYVVSHDGYTLRDLFSCTGHEYSWDHFGSEPQQRQAARNAITLLMTSAGVPMFTGGDELFRTQNCCTNPVALDTPSIHLNWSSYNKYAKAVKIADYKQLEQCRHDSTILMYRFTRSMIAFRSCFASLRPNCFFMGLDISGKGIKDITWYRHDGNEMSGTDWTRLRFLAWRIDNQEYSKPGDTGSIYIAYNWNDVPVDCTLPTPVSGMCWHRYADTAEWFEYAANTDENPVELDTVYGMHPRSILVLFEK